MTNLEKAARQALEALIASHGELDIRLASHDERLSKNKKAITALRQALEQPAKEPVAWMYDWHADGEDVTDWVSRDYDEAHSPTMGCHNIRPLYTRPQPAQEWQEIECPCCGDLARAFPPAPAREWVGLTESETMEAANKANTFIECVRMTAAKLKEKNT